MTNDQKNESENASAEVNQAANAKPDEVELTDADLDNVSGGGFKSIVDLNNISGDW